MIKHKSETPSTAITANNYDPPKTKEKINLIHTFQMELNHSVVDYETP